MSDPFSLRRLLGRDSFSSQVHLPDKLGLLVGLVAVPLLTALVLVESCLIHQGFARQMFAMVYLYAPMASLLVLLSALNMPREMQCLRDLLLVPEGPNLYIRALWRRQLLTMLVVGASLAALALIALFGHLLIFSSPPDLPFISGTLLLVDSLAGVFEGFVLAASLSTRLRTDLARSCVAPLLLLLLAAPIFPLMARRRCWQYPVLALALIAAKASWGLVAARRIEGNIQSFVAAMQDDATPLAM